MNNYLLIGSAVTEVGMRVKVICPCDEAPGNAPFEQFFIDHCHSIGMSEPHFFESVLV